MAAIYSLTAFFGFVKQRRLGTYLVERNTHVEMIQLSIDPDDDENLLIEFLNENGQSCITIAVMKNGDLNLQSYYYNSYRCERIPHEWFFNVFLKPLLKYIKGTVIELYDASYQVLPNCSLDALILSISKNKTFYQRYGFENAQFSSFLTDLATLSVNDVYEALLKNLGKDGLHALFALEKIEPDKWLERIGNSKIKRLAFELVSKCNDEDRHRGLDDEDEFLIKFLNWYVSRSGISKTWEFREKPVKRKAEELSVSEEVETRRSKGGTIFNKLKKKRRKTRSNRRVRV